jgi:tryptophan synthase alpha chain
MSARLDRCFADLQQAGRKALVAYLCVGDPSLEESVDLAEAAVLAGADVLELGVPFSDPTADGPAIARASRRAIERGATITRVIEVAAAVRARVAAPIVLFGYYNPIAVTGEARVVALAAEAGVDALLVVDLPPEEGAGLRAAAAAAGIALIPLIAPTTSAARAERVIAASGGRGFLYYVAVTGVTGSSQAGHALASEEAARLRERFGVPVVVGFGIDGAASAREAAGPRAGGASGIVVGTALVKAIEAAPTPEARTAAVRALISELRGALD